MSTIAEIEKAVPQFSAKELAELGQGIRKTRREKERAGAEPARPRAGERRQDSPTAGNTRAVA